MQGSSSILGYILGDVDVKFMVAFYFYVLFGSVLTMLLHYKFKQYKDARRKGVNKKFSVKYWIIDNTARLVTVLMVVFVLIVFKSKIPVFKDYELDTWFGFITGCSLDSIIIIIRNKTKLFQSKQNS